MHRVSLLIFVCIWLVVDAVMKCGSTRAARRGNVCRHGAKSAK